MHDPEFWRRLAEEFKTLDPRARLRLKWRYFPTSKRYHCEVVGRIDSRLIQVEFNSIAARAGKATHSPDPITGWLLQVIHISKNDKPRNGTVEEEGTGEVESYISGVVNRVCEASAILCYGFATQVASIDAREVIEEGRIMRPTSDEPEADLGSLAPTPLPHLNSEPIDIGAAVATPVQPTGTSGPTARVRKRGPKPNHAAALQAAEIVARVAPEGDWHSQLNDICNALDEAGNAQPARWRQKDKSVRGWVDYLEPAHAIKAIQYRLDKAAQLKKSSSETLS